MTERTKEELSAEIAQRLFEWKWYRRQTPITWTYFLAETRPEDVAMLAGKARDYDPFDVTDEYHGHLALEPYEGPPYASDHNAALGLVVPEMRKRGYGFELTGFAEGVMTATFVRLPWPKTRLAFSASAKDGEEPRAICLAALAALDQEGTK